MKNNLPRRIAHKVLRENKLYSFPDLDELKRIIELNRFTVIEYKKHTNSKYVSELIEKLGIENEISQNDSFLYVNNNLRFVFLNENVSLEDKCLLLCHELGHISDPHFESHQLNYSKIKREEFANEFSCYLKRPGIRFKLFMLMVIKWKLLVTVITIMIFLASLIFMIKPKTTPSVNFEFSDNAYYVTSSGKKYHKKHCIVVKYKNNLTKYTLDDAHKMGYNPCLICIGDE